LAAADGAGAAAETAAEAEAAFEAASEAWQAAALAQKQAMLQRAVDEGVAPTLEEAETALHHAERNASRDVACAICYENITEVPGRRFGLLTHCTHPFCLDCIREWRARIDLPNETVRACPLCRKTSFFVIPCDRFIADAARKAEVNASYHASQRSIPCRHFNYGKGTCPFGTSCFYAHLNPDGTPAIAPKHSIRLDADGNVGVTRSYKLNEFLGGGGGP
jgi:E3 ubiquitin-protein ligase makorin